MNPQVPGKQHDGRCASRHAATSRLNCFHGHPLVQRKPTQQSTQLEVYGTIVAVANQLAGGILSTSVVHSGRAHPRIVKPWTYLARRYASH
jgi:hypothetical protein